MKKLCSCLSGECTPLPSPHEGEVIVNDRKGTECVAEISPFCPECGERFDAPEWVTGRHESFRHECEHCGTKTTFETEIVHFSRAPRKTVAV
jgi:tRNA(Ile2) C34 agmatinyltransferase TiaS